MYNIYIHSIKISQYKSDRYLSEFILLCNQSLQTKIFPIKILCYSGTWTAWNHQLKTDRQGHLRYTVVP